MTSRLLSRRAFLLTLLVMVAGLQTSGQTVEHPVRVRLEPEVRDELSGLAWNSLTAECRRIWMREGVEIAWTASADDRASDDVSLPLVFDDRELRKRGPAGRSAFGLTTFVGRERRILVSVPHATQLIEAKTDHDISVFVRETALGRLLGRVVAHEIGHALLITKAHSSHGLMSAKLELGDVEVTDDTRFELSAPDRERLAIRFSGVNGRASWRRPESFVRRAGL